MENSLKASNKQNCKTEDFTFPVSPGAGCNVTEDGDPGGS